MASILPSSAYTTFHQFMDLPKELRLKVYGFALATRKRLHLLEYATPSKSIIVPGIGLLCSSKNIRNEALPVFYAVNQFCLHSDDESEPISPIDTSSLAKMRCVHIRYGDFITPTKFANIMNDLLDMFPRLHSLSFHMHTAYPYSPLDRTREAIRKLRQRVHSVRAIFFVQFVDWDEDELQDFLDVIRPHEEWRQQICGDVPYFPTWWFDTPDPVSWGLFRVWVTTWPGRKNKESR